ncbi:SGNH/GDSL hydrolase family protein [Streptomyces griseoluteus]|uniref:SGNH/GDSL hydrolase family protein n=1 Tax=Streptomyces griseoluteus TaxID=29306 RepID=UPI0033331291
MRHSFGGSPADFAMEKVGNTLLLRPGAVGTVWSAATGGTQYTDLTDTLGTPITQVTAESDGSVAFYGPDGVTSVYVDFGWGRRSAMEATDIGTVLANFMAQGGEPGGWAQLDGAGHLAPDQVDPAWFAGYASRSATAIESPGLYVRPGWGTFWRAARTATGPGGKATVAVLGSSSTVGFYSSNLVTKNWPALLAASLQTAYGDGGSGYASALFSSNGIAGQDSAAISAWTSAGNLVTQTGTWAIGGYQAGPGWGYLYASASGASLTWTVRGTSVTIYTLGKDGGRAAWTYSIDGGTAATVTDTATTGLTTLKTTITGLSSGTHTVKVTHAGSAGQYLSVCGVAAEQNGGVVLNNFGRKSATATDYLAPGRASWNGGPNYPADLVLYAVSPEDVLNGVSADTWASTVRQHLAVIRDGGTATGTTDIVIVLPHIGTADPNFAYQDFADRAHSLAITFEAALVNFWALGRNSWNYWNSLGYWGNPASPGTAGTDALHPSNAGHTYIAGVLNSLLQS